MFPMSGVGFMGRGVVAPWRYLHDEISGGIYVQSKIKCIELFSGTAITIPLDTAPPPNLYGYSDNILNYASMAAKEVANNTVRSGSQRGSVGVISEANCYLVDENDIGYTPYSNNLGSPLLNYNIPCTFIFCYDRAGNPSGSRGIMINCIRASPDDRLTLRETSSGKYQMLGLRNGSVDGQMLVETTSTYNTTGNKIIAMTYDGSQNVSGINIYVNDMTTPVALTTLNNTLVGDAPSTGFNRFFVGGQSGLNINGKTDEAHIFSTELTSAELVTAKQILEQYYTFT